MVLFVASVIAQRGEKKKSGVDRGRENLRMTKKGKMGEIGRN